MNFKKIIAAVATAALAVSAMAVNTFALTTETHRTDATLYVVSEKPDEEKPSWITNSGYSISDVYGVTYHVTFNADEVANEDTWIGGGIGANSQSTGWKQVEWGRKDKEITADLENGTITWLSDSPVFKDSDTYAQFWLQTWGGTVTVNSIDVLGKDGTVISDDTPDPAEEAETEATEETTEATEATEEAAEEATEAETEAEVEEVAEEPEVVEDEPEVVEEVVEDVEAVEEPAEEVVVVTEAPVADTAATPVAATGNTAASAIAVVMVAAGVAALISKRK